MKRKRSLGLVLSMSLIGALSFIACDNNVTGDGSGSGRQGTKCAQYDGDKDKCEKAQENGKACEYDDKAKKCLLPGGGGGDGEKCAQLDEKACKISDQCDYDAASKKCDAAKKTGCPAIQDKTACTNASCDWVGNECKDKVSTSDVFTWTKANLPADASLADISELVMSGDKNHLYAYNNKSGKTKGLYHSDDEGQTWTRVGNKGDGVVSGKPYSGSNVKSRNINTTKDAVTLKATQNGVVLFTGKKVFILAGKDAKWGLNSAWNADVYANRLSGYVTGLKNENIKFVDVVKTQTGESIVFGQQSANTVFIADAAGKVSATSAPKPFDTKLRGGAPLKQVWIRAGNTHNDNLLLASANGIWEFPKANTDPSSAAEFGKTDSDTAKLFPEVDAAGVNWKTTNVDIHVIGSFDDAGTHHYFAGLGDGLAHHKGPQVAPQHASLSFTGSAIFGVSQDGGVVRLLTSKGVKGVSVNGAPHGAHDFKFDDIANNKHEMNDDKTAIGDLAAAENDSAKLLGDADKSVVWVSSKGIWIRKKSTGQPRP